MTVPIQFTDVSGFVAPEFYPTPAKQSFPDWYGDLKPFHNTVAPREKTQTAKRCVPVLDSFTTGYILYTPTDVEVTIDGNGRTKYLSSSRLCGRLGNTP